MLILVRKREHGKMLLTEERKPLYNDKRSNQPGRDDSYELCCGNI